MKVVDLLNKIADKDVPKKIKIFNDIYAWCDTRLDYQSIEDGDWFLESYSLCEILNTEIEIIEEDKPIKKLDEFRSVIFDDVITPLNIIGNKINEIIDYLEKRDM